MAKASDYYYLPLADAKKSVNFKVNLFAKVAEIGVARKTRGTDYVLTLRLVDQSHPAPGIPVNIFAENIAKLPQLKCAGDIISLQRVEMKIHNGEVYCVFNKRFSSFALFNGKTDVGFSAYQTSARYHVTNDDDKFLRELRMMSPDHQSHPGLTTNLLLLRNIEIGKAFDIICKVLHVSQTAQGVWMLFVWDGTDSPPSTLQTDLDMEYRNPCPLHLEELPLAREILCAFPHVGTVLRVSVSNNFEEIQHLRDGDYWVRLCNIECQLLSGMWKGVMGPSSRTRILSNDDDNVRLRQRIYDERAASKMERMPLMSFPSPDGLTEVDFGHKGYATLIDSLTHPKVTHQCMSIVRVVAACPWRGEDLNSPVDGHFRVRLTLEDPTARIHAFIDEEDGVTFFGGYPSPDELTRKMNKLLGIKDGATEEGISASRFPPWIWCFLKSYYLDKTDPWGSRRYKISRTRIL